MTAILEPNADPSLALDDLSRLVLSPANQFRLGQALATNSGEPAWQARKEKESRVLLAISQVAGRRLKVLGLNLFGDLKALLRLTVPVALRPDPSNELRIASSALIGLSYPPEAVRHALPGAAFVQILEPREVWYPAVHLPEQSLCLGDKLPQGIRVRSLILMTFGALAAQTMIVDERDGAGVMNVEAAQWWQRNPHRRPLTRSAFLDTNSAGNDM